MVESIDKYLRSLVNNVSRMVKTYKYIDDAGTERFIPIIKSKEE